MKREAGRDRGTHRQADGCVESWYKAEGRRAAALRLLSYTGRWRDTGGRQ